MQRLDDSGGVESLVETRRGKPNGRDSSRGARLLGVCDKELHQLKPS
jgi:hypothetical protein